MVVCNFYSKSMCKVIHRNDFAKKIKNKIKEGTHGLLLKLHFDSLCVSNFPFPIWRHSAHDSS